MLVDVSDNELLLLEFFRTMDVKNRLQVMKQAEKYANNEQQTTITIYHTTNTENEMKSS